MLCRREEFYMGQQKTFSVSSGMLIRKEDKCVSSFKNGRHKLVADVF